MTFKVTLNNTKKRLSVNKPKSAVLTLLNQNPLTLSKVTPLATNCILFQEQKKV